MLNKLLSNRKKLCLLVLGGALLLAGVVQSQAARNFLGWPSSAAPQAQDEPAAKGRATTRQVAPPAPVNQSKDEMAALRERAQLNREPTSRANLMDLLAESETILRGHIISVRDGLPQGGLPYTEVTLRVVEVVRGNAGEPGSEFRFRQFGLINPRRVSNKRTMLNLTPAGWATYKEGEDVILFLHAPASLTGLRAPIGLAQGKFVVDAGNAVSQAGNFELFAGMEVPENLVQENERAMLRTTQGPVNATAFLSLVRRAVGENWVERGMMRHVRTEK